MPVLLFRLCGFTRNVEGPAAGLSSGEIAGAPHVPGCHGSIGSPFSGAAEHDVGFGQVGSLDGPGFWELHEGEGVAFANAVVGYGEDVGPAEAEDEQHFDGPRADAADFGEAFDDVGIGHFQNGLMRGHGAIDGFGGEVAHGLDLVAGNAGGAQRVVGDREELLRCGVAAEVLTHAAVDGGGGFAVQLLVEDCLKERFKGRWRLIEPEGECADAIDQCAQFRVALL